MRLFKDARVALTNLFLTVMVKVLLLSPPGVGGEVLSDEVMVTPQSP